MLEYGILVGSIAASLVLMSVYLKRGYSGGIKSQADSLGTQYDMEGITATSTYTLNSRTVSNTYIANVTIRGQDYFGLVTDEVMDENVTQTTDQTITK